MMRRWRARGPEAYAAAVLENWKEVGRIASGTMTGKLGAEFLHTLGLGAAALIGHHGQTNLPSLDRFDQLL
jgi:hypothetical protein